MQLNQEKLKNWKIEKLIFYKQIVLIMIVIIIILTKYTQNN